MASSWEEPNQGQGARRDFLISARMVLRTLEAGSDCTEDIVIRRIWTVVCLIPGTIHGIADLDHKLIPPQPPHPSSML